MRVAYLPVYKRQEIMNEQVTLIVKVTGRCNLACSYCYYTQLGSQDSPSVLAPDDLRLILEKAALKWRTVRVIFHGGEPLLLGAQYFKDILTYENELSHATGVRFRNCVQTNGTVFTEEISNLLRAHNVGIGLSIDGTSTVQAHNRPFKGMTTQNSFSKVLQTLDQMLDAALHVSCIVVATRETVKFPNQIYTFFRNRNLDFKINELVSTPNQDNILPTQEEMATFVCRIFDIWISDTKRPAIRVRPLSSILSSFWSGRVSDCTHRSCCTQFLSVETEGTAYVCDRFNHLPEFAMGNILLTSWDEILTSVVAQRFDRRRSELPQECKDCEWLIKCWGGCTASATINATGLNDKTYWCEARKHIFDHVQNSLSNILSS